MTEDFHVSPSQLVTYIHGCARYWAFSYIYGLKEPTGEAADRGHHVHKVLEDWQLYAKPPDLTTLYGRIAKPAIKYTPPPMTPGVFPEKEVHWVSPRGNHFMFLKDLEQPAGPTAYIWDYKSTSNLKYAHTTEELLNTDPQGIIYPAHRFIVSPDVTEVKCAWLYLPSSPPHYCHPVYAVHEKKHCLERFDLLDTIAGYMLEHRRQRTNPLAFAPNPGHCRAFNRQCPFTDRCNLSDLEKMIAMTQSSLGPVSNHFLEAIGRIASYVGPTPGAGAPATQQLPTVQPPQPTAAGFALVNLCGVPASAPVSSEPIHVPAPPLFSPPAPVFTAPAAAPQTAPQLPWQVPAPAAAVPIHVQAGEAPPQLPWQSPNTVVVPEPPVQVPEAPAPAVGPSRVFAPAEPGAQLQVATEHPIVVMQTNTEPQPVATAKRKRRTKAEMEAARAAAVNGTATADQAEALNESGEDEGPESYEARVGEEIHGTLLAPPEYVTVRAPDTLLTRVALAMASNPAYCALDSISFAARARAIVVAVQNEENDL